MRIHKGLDQERWSKFTLFEQLANVVTDIERVIGWKKRGNLDYSRKAFDRALELLDLTISDKKNKHGTLRELLRVREALIDYFLYDNQYLSDDKGWQDYFYQFNYAAAIQRGK